MWLVTSCVITLLLLLSPGDTTAQPLPGCLDPPYNNQIAEIIVNALEAARPLLETGIPSLGVPPLDPLGPLPPIMFSMQNEALVLEGSVNETLVMNLAQFIICQVNVSIGLTQEVYFEFRLDNFHMQGLYDIDGLAVSLFPIFGNGNYTLDTYNAGFAGSAKITYNVLQDTISISKLSLDIFFEELVLFFECILGCGDMADFINSHLGDIGEAIFNSVWTYIEPIISNAIENIVNDALKNVSISEIIPKENLVALTALHAVSKRGLGPQQDPETKEMGNANEYLDSVLWIASRKIVKAGLDPAALPDRTVDLGAPTYAEIRNSSLSGLSTVRRSGTATVDTVTDWIFLYANIAVGPIMGVYPGTVYDGESTDTFEISFSIDIIDIYITARGDTYSNVLDLDQFVISELGPVNIEVEGLGVMGWLAESLSDMLLNIFLDDIQGLLSNQLKEAIQQALNENPWPAP